MRRRIVLNATSPRGPGRRAMLVVLALILGACSPGAEQTQDENDPSPTPEREGVQPAAEPTPVPDNDEEPAPEPQQEPEAFPEPEDALLALFAAIEDGDRAAQLELSTAGLEALLRIREIIRHENARRGGTTTNDITITEPPHVLERDEDTASVSVQARWRSAVSGEEGVVPSEVAVSGPVSLQRTSAGWAVADLVYGERPLAPEHVPVGERQVRGEIALELHVVQGYGGVNGVVLSLSHEQGERVSVNITRLELTLDDGTSVDPTQVALTDTTPPELFAAFDRSDARPTTLEVDLQNRQNDQRLSYVFTF